MGNQSNRALLSDYLLGQQSSSFGRNYVLNPSGFENVNNISISGSATVTRNTTTPLTAISDLSVSLPNDTSSGVTWTLNTLDNSLNGQNCMLSFDYTSSSLGSAVQAQVLQGSNISATVTLNPASTSKNVILNTPCGNLGSATTVVIANTSGNSGSSTLNVANVNYGKATNIGTVAQAQLWAQVTITGCNWSTTSTSYTDVTSSGCTYTFTPNLPGNCSAPGSEYPGLTCSSMPDGNYELKTQGEVHGSLDGNVGNFRFSDGTNNTSGASCGVNGTSANAFCPGIDQTLQYSNPQTNVTLRVQAQSTAGSSVGMGTIDPFVISVYYYPTQSQLAVNSNLIFNPQVTVYTSGSGTYTVPNGTAYLEVEMVGGGGGGAGSGTGVVGVGGGGGTTTFGTSLLTCTGGGGSPNYSSGGGGTATLNIPAFGNPINGAYGASASFQLTNINGGNGGSSPFGGAGGGGVAGNGAGGAGAANTGAGGGGAGTGSTASSSAGAGGGSGAYIKATINNPSATYSYSVGTGGAGGTAGGSGAAGGAGSSGVIIVTAYPAQNAPILVGSVTSSGAGQYHVESAQINADCSVENQSGSWISSTDNPNTGQCTLTLSAGEFSSAPTCVASVGNGGPGNTYVTQTFTSSVTALNIGISNGETPTNASFCVICMGSH